MPSARMAIAFALALPVVSGQTPRPLPEFEVASVKPGVRINGLFRIFPIRTYPGGRIVIQNNTLEMLLQVAFSVGVFQIKGGPAWIDSDRYYVEAKPPASSKSSRANPPSPEAPPNEEQRQMLAALLINRFQLKFHRETKEGLVYSLERGDKKIKMTESKDEGGPYRLVGLLGGGDGSVHGYNVSMLELAAHLSDSLEHPVLDRTGIEGLFNFRVEHLSDDPHPDLASLALGLVRELGLKLETGKGPVETLVVDHAEKPDEN
jgi:uncharacterized protein (TIGR03435 family)